jgi:crotonobetainyl-CoA:carnitine CoA-transferase CaiB-like acyl-CoA transferase
LNALDGIRVLDLSRFQACPLAGMLLGDLGAEVIRVEEPGGAADRAWGQCGPDGESLLFKVVARNKKSITLRLNTPNGREVLKDLVKCSDVVLHNYTPGAPVGKEVNYQRLSEINPKIIVAALSGYGQDGPDAERPCFDGVAQARSGGMVLNGFPGDPPIKTGMAYIDIGTGLLATVGVLAALHHRESTGRGQAVDVCLFDTSVFMMQAMGALLLQHFYGEIRQQIGNRGFHSYNTCLQAKDGWVVLSVVTNSIWKRFVEKMGRPEMADDPRYGSDMDRFRNADSIDAVVKDWVAARTVAEVIRLCEQARVPCGPLQTVDKLLSDPQVLARQMVQQFDYGAVGKLPVPGTPIKLSETPGVIRTPSPKLSEHNEEIYRGLLGFSAEKLEQLRGEGTI